jgi:hypothetical protein
MGSPDHSSSRRQTCPWNLARGVPSAHVLEELVPGWDTGVTPDLAPCLELGQASLFDLVPSVPQPYGTDSGPQADRR